MSFLRSLKKNNKREWFQPRKEIFEEKVRAPMFELIEALNAALIGFAPDYVTDPKSAVYRVYRDTRFSPDKTPYKTHIAASFVRRGLQRHISAGFYFEVSPEESGVAAGVYMPGPEELLTLRTFLADNYEEYCAVTQGAKVRKLLGEVVGEQLTRVPKGFACDHPAAEALRRKQWYFWAPLDAGLATTERFYKEVLDRFRAAAPFIEFINRPLLGKVKKSAARGLI